MAMPRRRRIEAAHQAAVAVAKIRPFAQPRLQVVPSFCVSQIIRDKCPQGRDESLIRSPSCRKAATMLRGTKKIAVFIPQVCDDVVNVRLKTGLLCDLRFRLPRTLCC